jgi:hypothetical protein
MKSFYVYRLLFTDNTYYIGYRGSCQLPSDDLLIKYFTSSKIVKAKLLNCHHTATILHENLSKEDAYTLEQNLIHQCIDDILCLNERCYLGRNGFGLISASARQKISNSSKDRWSDPAYREKLSNIHKARWKDSDLKEKQQQRLTGVKRPEHAAKMKGRTMSEDQKETLRKPKHPGHGKAVSLALSGVSKSESHKSNLGISRQKYEGVFVDHLGNSYEHHREFLEKYKLDRSFFDCLDKPIRYRAVYNKLGIEYNSNKNKTRRELGFRFQEILV